MGCQSRVEEAPGITQVEARVPLNILQCTEQLLPHNTTKNHSASNAHLSLSWRLINHGIVQPVGKCGAEGKVEVGECSLSKHDIQAKSQRISMCCKDRERGQYYTEMRPCE